MNKKKILLLAVFLLVPILLARAVSAANIGLVVYDRNMLNEDERRIYNMINDLGHDIVLVDGTSNVDYGLFDLTVITYTASGEYLKSVPVNEIPVISLKPSYLDSWNWVKSAGISYLYSSARQHAYVIAEHPLSRGYSLDQTFYIHAADGKNLVDIEKAYTNMTFVLSQDRYGEMGLVAYARPNAQLMRGQKISSSSAAVYFGITYPTFWTDDAVNIFKNSVNWFTKDTDLDGLKDYLDNCPYIYNPEQTDTDGDGAGDLCSSIDRRPDLVIDTILTPSTASSCSNAVVQVVVRNIGYYAAASYTVDLNVGGKTYTATSTRAIDTDQTNTLSFSIFASDLCGSSKKLLTASVSNVQPNEISTTNNNKSLLFVFTTVKLDVDSDGTYEQAIDQNKNVADGYEVYSDPNKNTEARKIDGDNDGKADYLIDIAKNGTYEKYWDPDDDTLTNVAYSGSNMVLIDTNGDGAFDISFNLATGLASYLDQVAPSVGAITITPSWGSSTWYKFNISAAVSDNTGINPSSCQYTIDGTNWLTADYSAGKCYKNNVQSSIGNTLTINVRVKDVAGSTGVGTTISKTVAKRPLTVTVTLDKSTYSAGEVVNASGYVSYSDSGEKLPSININYSVASVAGNAQADTTSYYAFSFTAPSSGSYTLAVTAENSYSSGSGTASFTIPSAQSSSNGSNAGIIDIIMPSRITAEASSSASFEVTIKNVGTATLHSVKVKADGMPSSVEPNDIYDIDPDDSQVFTVTLDVPSTPGEYIIKITALSMEYNPIKYLSVVVTEKPMPKLNVIGITVPQLEEGKPAEIVLTIENTGAASTTATVTVSMPTGWVADDITKNIDIAPGAEEVSFIMTPSVSGVLRFITTYDANGEKTITNTTEVEVKPKESLIPIGLTGMLVAVASDPAVSIPASLAFVGVLGLKFKKKISSLFERFRSSESVAPARRPRHRASSYDSWERRYKSRK